MRNGNGFKLRVQMGCRHAWQPPVGLASGAKADGPAGSGSDPREIQEILRRCEITYRGFIGACVLIGSLVLLAILASWIC